MKVQLELDLATFDEPALCDLLTWLAGRAREAQVDGVARDVDTLASAVRQALNAKIYMDVTGSREARCVDDFAGREVAARVFRDHVQVPQPVV